MIVIMTEKEKKTIEYANRFKKDWMVFCAVSDAYLNGYRQAREDILNGVSQLNTKDPNVLSRIEDEGERLVEVEFANGSHQIGSKSTDGVSNAS